MATPYSETKWAREAAKATPNRNLGPQFHQVPPSQQRGVVARAAEKIGLGGMFKTPEEKGHRCGDLFCPARGGPLNDPGTRASHQEHRQQGAITHARAMTSLRETQAEVARHQAMMNPRNQSGFEYRRQFGIQTQGMNLSPQEAERMRKYGRT